MRFTRLVLLSFCVASIVGLSSCKTTPETPEEQTLVAKDYSSLAVGNAWTYSVKAQGSAAEEKTVTIQKENKDGFFEDDMGAKLKVRRTGIFDGDRFLLEDPLEVGHKWLAVQGPSSVERYETTAVDMKVTVPAGVFEGCVQVRAKELGRTQTGARTKMVVEWTYAPHVGLVEMKQTVQLGAKPPVKMIHLQLVRFNKAQATQP
ncbi:MAG: hypothetical protein GY822_13400 [Deltaproteobacteria bacterium]|nr:hypothetical protein [Deltaproteobacteria bacterium]